MKVEKLKGGIFLTPKDIQNLQDCTLNTARIEHRTIRDTLGIKHGKLTIKQWADYWEIDIELVIFKLNDSR